MIYLDKRHLGCVTLKLLWWKEKNNDLCIFAEYQRQNCEDPLDTCDNVCGASIQDLGPIQTMLLLWLYKGCPEMWLMPHPGNIQGQVEEDSEQPDLVEDVPAYCRDWTRWALSFPSLPNHPTILWIRQKSAHVSYRKRLNPGLQTPWPWC